jgi:hypothetical protein
MAGSTVQHGGLRRGTSVLVLVVLAGCSSAGPTPGSLASAASTIATSPSAIATPSASQTAPPSAEPVATTYTSSFYGYSLTLLAGWQVVPASIRWDGISDPGHDEPTVDQMSGPSGPSISAAWAFSIPVTKDLKGYASERLAADATVHPCPKTAATTTQITIDGTPGLLMTRDCGILVLTALTIKTGAAFVFYLQDSSIHGPTDPTDEATFASMLASVRLPK